MTAMNVVICQFCKEKMISGRSLESKTRTTMGICSKCNSKAERLATHLKRELTPLMGGNIIKSPSALEKKAMDVRDACVRFVTRCKEENVYGNQELKYAVLTKKGNVSIEPMDQYTRAFFNWIFSKAR